MINAINRPTVSKLFFMAAIAILVIGTTITLTTVNSALDIYVNDSYYVVSFFQLVASIAILLGFFSVFYLLLARSYRKRMNNLLSYLHFGITALCAIFALIPNHFFGFAIAPRRYYSYDEPGIFEDFINLNPMLSIILIVGIAGQIVFTVNLSLAILEGQN